MSRRLSLALLSAMFVYGLSTAFAPLAWAGVNCGHWQVHRHLQQGKGGDLSSGLQLVVPNHDKRPQERRSMQ